MYSQTAAMLESCAHAALRAEAPALASQGVALLAERLAAVSRLRAAHCMRNGEWQCGWGTGCIRFEGRQFGLCNYAFFLQVGASAGLLCGAAVEKADLLWVLGLL